VLVTGAGGQLGGELRETVPTGWRFAGYDRADLDVTRADIVNTVLQRERPSLVIHSAAYTAVDAAESEPDRAEEVNTRGTANIAEAARRFGARLIYLSTDFVYDGAQGIPYLPSDPANPLSVYGRTKLAGEREVERIFSGRGLILRTAWVYSTRGHNFVRTMLRLLGERDSVGVVSDQIGTPTWARGLAEAIWVAALRPQIGGLHHWTDAGVASWYDVAIAIREEALALGLLPRAVPVYPLRTEDVPTPAKRPRYSVLDKTATWAALEVQPRHWRENLRAMLRGLTNA
jgi:dTDP-4-dehydrorhamnose reductase